MSSWRLTGAAPWSCWERWICFASAWEWGHTGQGLSPFLSPPVQCWVSVCLSHSHLPQPLTNCEELSWTQQLPSAALLLPASPYSFHPQGSWGLLKTRCMDKALLGTLFQVCRPQHTSQDLFCCVYMESLLVQTCSTDHVVCASQISWACIMLPCDCRWAFFT